MRIRSLASGHTPLNLLISELSSTRQRYKDLLSSQTSCAKKVEKWSQAEENPALQDVLHQVYELNLMWVETQREFVVALKEYKRLFESILEMEKRLDQARKNLVSHTVCLKVVFWEGKEGRVKGCEVWVSSS